MGYVDVDQMDCGILGAQYVNGFGLHKLEKFLVQLSDFPFVSRLPVPSSLYCLFEEGLSTAQVIQCRIMR
jgi:hypothetical protein